MLLPIDRVLIEPWRQHRFMLRRMDRDVAIVLVATDAQGILRLETNPCNAFSAADRRNYQAHNICI